MPQITLRLDGRKNYPRTIEISLCTRLLDDDFHQVPRFCTSLINQSRPTYWGLAGCKGHPRARPGTTALARFRCDRQHALQEKYWLYLCRDRATSPWASKDQIPSILTPTTGALNNKRYIIAHQKSDPNTKNSDTEPIQAPQVYVELIIHPHINLHISSHYNVTLKIWKQPYHHRSTKKLH